MILPPPTILLRKEIVYLFTYAMMMFYLKSQCIYNRTGSYVGVVPENVMQYSYFSSQRQNMPLTVFSAMEELLLMKAP